jgi:hypothetical protein
MCTSLGLNKILIFKESVVNPAFCAGSDSAGLLTTEAGAKVEAAAPGGPVWKRFPVDKVRDCLASPP